MSSKSGNLFKQTDKFNVLSLIALDLLERGQARIQVSIVHNSTFIRIVFRVT